MPITAYDGWVCAGCCSVAGAACSELLPVNSCVHTHDVGQGCGGCSRVCSSCDKVLKVGACLHV